MPTIRPFKALFSLSTLLSAALLLTGCGDDVGVSPASATSTATATSAAPPATSAPTSPAPPASPKTGSATLSWTAPTENTNGTPVTDLAGYHIYYGTTEGAWTSTITVLEATETSYVVSGLAPGTYYFTVVAFNTAGDDSPESNVASKTI
jgi:Fibronectin type III domain